MNVKIAEKLINSFRPAQILHMTQYCTLPLAHRCNCKTFASGQFPLPINGFKASFTIAEEQLQEFCINATRIRNHSRSKYGRRSVSLNQIQRVVDRFHSPRRKEDSRIAGCTMDNRKRRETIAQSPEDSYGTFASGAMLLFTKSRRPAFH